MGQKISTSVGKKSENTPKPSIQSLLSDGQTPEESSLAEADW